MELVRDKIHKEIFMVTKLINMLKREELRLDHPLQRDADQFSSIERDGLIATVIKNEDIDPIQICEQLGENGVTLWLINGKQRLTTIRKFKQGVFKLGKTVEFPIIKYQVAKRDVRGNVVKKDGDIQYDIVEYDLREKGYEDLPEELKEVFDNYNFNVVKYLNCTDEEIGYHIRRHNRNVKMNASQDSVTYMDKTAKYVKDISQNSRFFKDCGVYSPVEIKKGVIDRIVTESIMSEFHLQDWKKNGKKMGAYVNNHSNKEEFDTLKSELSRLEKVIDKPMELFNSKNTFIFLPLFHKFTSFNIVDSRFVDFLDKLVESLHCVKVDGLSFDDMEENRATKDKKTIEQKLHILESLMIDFLQVGKNDESNGEYKNVLDFVKENVFEDVTDDDVVLYEDMLSDLTLSVNNDTKLLEEENHKSLIGMVAYGCLKDFDLDEWVSEYFSNNNTYIRDQKRNYELMRGDFDSYVVKNKIA